MSEKENESTSFYYEFKKNWIVKIIRVNVGFFLYPPVNEVHGGI